MIILGIDPGIASIGYGLVKEGRKNNLKCLGYGIIRTNPSSSSSERLKKINKELSILIKEYKPKVLAMERVFFARNLKTAIAVSRAEGVILFTAAKKKIPVYQFTPLQVKMAITGYGWAKKALVQKKINRLLKLKEMPKSDDAVDALAIALTYLTKNKESTHKILKNIKKA